VGYGKLASSTPVRIAAGEHESDRQSYQNLMDQGQIDVVQVDLTRCGGFTEAMKIASLAYDRGLPVANHGFSTYLNVAAALHWLNSIPNALICEFVAQEATNLREQITRQKLARRRRLSLRAAGAGPWHRPRRGGSGAVSSVAPPIGRAA
jgi:L-rhamnonate dehydratase